MECGGKREREDVSCGQQSQSRASVGRVEGLTGGGSSVALRSTDVDDTSSNLLLAIGGEWGPNTGYVCRESGALEDPEAGTHELLDMIYEGASAAAANSRSATTPFSPLGAGSEATLSRLLSPPSSTAPEGRGYSAGGGLYVPSGGVGTPTLTNGGVSPFPSTVGALTPDAALLGSGSVGPVLSGRGSPLPGGGPSSNSQSQQRTASRTTARRRIHSRWGIKLPSLPTDDDLTNTLPRFFLGAVPSTTVHDAELGDELPASPGAALNLVPLLSACLPIDGDYQFNRHTDKLGEGTYGAVYAGTRKKSSSAISMRLRGGQMPLISNTPPPQDCCDSSSLASSTALLAATNNDINSPVAIKLLKQLPNFDGFPLTSIREISVHKYLQSVPPEQRSNLLVMEDLRIGLNTSGVGAGTEGSAEEQALHPSQRRGSSCEGVEIYLIFPYVEHTLSSLRRCIRGGPSSALSTPERPLYQLPPLRVIDEDFIIHIFVQVMQGLRQLHSANIMHRDIKEDNILVTRNGVVQIADFGLAVPLGGNRAQVTPSLINPFYRPPEMLLGSRSYSTAVDVWSAGCMLAQQFLGVPPFISRTGKPDTDLEQLIRVVHAIGPLPRPMVFSPSIREEVRRVIVSHPAGLVGPPVPNPTHRPKLFSSWFMETLQQRRDKYPQACTTCDPSPLLLRIMDRMFEPDPDRRISVDQILQCRCEANKSKLPQPLSLLEEALRQRQEASLVGKGGGGQMAVPDQCLVCRAKAVRQRVSDGIRSIPPPRTHIHPSKLKHQLQGAPN